MQWRRTVARGGATGLVPPPCKIKGKISTSTLTMWVLPPCLPIVPPPLPPPAKVVSVRGQHSLK